LALSVAKRVTEMMHLKGRQRLVTFGPQNAFPRKSLRDLDSAGCSSTIHGWQCECRPNRARQQELLEDAEVLRPYM